MGRKKNAVLARAARARTGNFATNEGQVEKEPGTCGWDGSVNHICDDSDDSGSDLGWSADEESERDGTDGPGWDGDEKFELTELEGNGAHPEVGAQITTVD
ncbi:hypothetical protein PQX77_015903 [Marasmius sp. AFHP31]|nr:hypothetical protein PQX77_015903 [Marasmius sp. AFHP31]